MASKIESLPWVEKYRPTTFEELSSQGDILSTIDKLIENQQLPHLLLYGPPGTGKTTTALAIARKIYGKNYSSMILELNASDERGIDVVRENIKEFANTRNIFSKGVKIIILDEADQMTGPAQMALRRVIEKFTKSARFFILCNYLNKISPAIQSRCSRFRFGPLNPEDVGIRLEAIAKQEGANLTSNGLSSILKISGGDMRKCLNIMQSCHMAYPEITEETVHLCTGQPLPTDIEQIVDWMLNENFEIAYKHIAFVQKMKGLALQDIITEIHKMVLKMQIPNDAKILLLEKLADVEFRLSACGSEKLNLGATIGIFQLVKQKLPDSN